MEIIYERQSVFYKIIYPDFNLKLFDHEGSPICVGTLHGPVSVKYEAIPETGGARFVEVDIPSPIIQKLLEEVFTEEEKKYYVSFKKTAIIILWCCHHTDGIFGCGDPKYRHVQSINFISIRYDGTFFA